MVPFEISLSQLQLWGITEPAKGLRNLQSIGVTLGAEDLTGIRPHLSRMLPRLADPDMALNNLERFFNSPVARVQLPTLLEQRGHTLETLLQIFSVSQFFADLLVNDPELVKEIHGPLRPSPTRDELIAELRTALDQLKSGDAVVLHLERRGELLFLAFTVE